jgi:hypothetical protein
MILLGILWTPWDFNNFNMAWYLVKGRLSLPARYVVFKKLRVHLHIFYPGRSPLSMFMDFFSCILPYCVLENSSVHEKTWTLMCFTPFPWPKLELVFSFFCTKCKKKRIKLKPIKLFWPFWIPYITNLFDSLLLFLFFYQIDGASLR